MKNVLEIEKKNAVKEFVEKLKAIISGKGTLVRDYTGDKLVLRCEIDVDEALESIDELFQEVLGMTKNRDKRYPVAIDDLLIEFDEMDYCPMNLSGGDPVKEAIAWRDRLRYELDLLLDEKSAIERRAVEEFAKKIKEKALSHCKIINCYELTFIEETINELLKDYEK